MDTHYTLLGVAPEASADEIVAAYRQARARYDADRVAALGDEFARVSRERVAALDRAFAALSDPERRAAYDRSLAAPHPSGARRERPRLSRREGLMLAAGAIAGLLVIAVVWSLAGRTSQPSLIMAEINRPAPPLALRDLSGETLDLARYRNQNIVMLNFWWTDCPPCQEETPALQAAYQKLASQGLVVIGVNVRGNERRGPEGDADVRRFVERYGVTYPIVFDDQGEAGREYQVLPLPTTFFIDKSGVIRYASYRAITIEDVERVFSELQRQPLAAR